MRCRAGLCQQTYVSSSRYEAIGRRGSTQSRNQPSQEALTSDAALFDDAYAKVPPARPGTTPPALQGGQVVRPQQAVCGQTAGAAQSMSGSRSLLRNKMCEQGVPLGRSQRSRLSFLRNFVVSPSGALLRRSLLFWLPLRLHKFIALQSPKCWVDGSAGEASNLHNVQAITVAETDCLENQGSGMRQPGHVHIYVVYYHW